MNNRTRLIRRGAVPNMAGGEIFPRQGPKWRYQFDGSSFVTMPAWAAQGRPREYEISFNVAAVNTGQEQYLFSGIDAGIRIDMFLQATNARLQVQYRSATGTQANEVVLSPLIEAGVDYKIEIKKLGGDAVILINGQPGTPFLTIPGMGLQPPISTIGAREDGAFGFIGSIWGVDLTDGSPLQDGTLYYLDGSNTLGELFNTIECDANGDFTIEFDWERTIVSGTGSQWLLGNVDDVAYYLRAYDEGNLRLNFGAARTWTNALGNVSEGQRNRYKFSRVAGVLSLEIDGAVVEDGPSGIHNDYFALNWIGRGATGTLGRGLFGNLRITAAAPEPVLGFVPYGTPHSRLVDEFSGTSASNMGLLEDKGAVEISYTDDGYQNVGTFNTFKQWPAALIEPLRAADGYTLCMDIEKGFFSDLSLPNQRTPFVDLYYLSSIGVTPDTENWRRVTGLGEPEYEGFKTIDDGYSDTHVRLAISVHPDGAIDIYANGFLMQQSPVQSDPPTLNGEMAPMGNNFTYPSPTYRTRNVSLYAGVIDYAVAGRTRTVAVVGDSFTTWGQYQSGYTDNESDILDANNAPAYTGWPTEDIEGIQAKYEFKNSSLFAGLHSEMAKKGTYVDGQIGYYGRSLAAVTFPFVDDSYLFSRRVDAALGEGVPTYPAPGMGTADYWVSQVCSNDLALVLSVDPGGVNWVGNINTIIADYTVQIDRMIDSGNAQFIAVVEPTPRWESEGGDLEQGSSAITRQFNEALAAALDGYRGVVSVVPLPDYDNTMTQDGTHPNAAGQSYIAQQIGLYLPDAAVSGTNTFNFPMTEGSGLRITNTNTGTGVAYDGQWNVESWVQSPENSRAYALNEGPDGNGIVTDKYGNYDGTIQNYNADDWVKP